MSTDEFNLTAARERRDSGKKHAADTRRALLIVVRKMLVAKAQRRSNRTAHADDAARALLSLGYPADALGNASGSLFKRNEWEPTGEWRASRRTTNHARRSQVWRLRSDC
jgi:hypothetical protein